MNPGLLKSSALFSFAALSIALASAQTSYVAYDLSPDAVGAAAENGYVGGHQGFLTNGISTRHATIWDGRTGASIDLHPLFSNLATGGYSIITGMSSSLQVGYASDSATSGQLTAVQWHGSFDTARRLALPYENTGSQATSTDGKQIGGFGFPVVLVDGVKTFGTAHATVWDATTGLATDLAGKTPSYILGVGGGQQVGYEVPSLAQARLWRGTARSKVSLHPKGPVTSQAVATDGVHQVGYAGYDVRNLVDHKGGKARVNLAQIWSGTAASMTALDSTGYPISYANAIRNDVIAGYCSTVNNLGKPVNNRAMAWVGPTHQRVDLHNFLPAGFSNSTAWSVDSAGNVVGYANKPDGSVHAILWHPVAP